MKADPRVIEEVFQGVVDRVQRWPGVSIDARPAVTNIVLGRGVLARMHAEGLVEIPFPRPVAEELIAAGRAEHHHVLPDSGWVDYRIRSADDLGPLLELLRLAFEARNVERSADAGSMVDRAAMELDEKIDESVEESFPASDPPAIGRN